MASAGEAVLSREDDRLHANRDVIFKAVKAGKRVTAEKLEALKALGFDGIEGSAPGIVDFTAYRSEVEGAGLVVHGVVDNAHWKMRLSSPNPEDRSAGRQALEEAIVAAKALGGSSVLLVPGKVSGEEETHDHVWERSLSEVQGVLPLASENGIWILIETVWNGFCESPEAMRDYIDAFQSPWVGSYFDIGNMQKFAPAEEWIRILGPRIVKLDVKDWGQAAGFCKLGEGDVEWPEVRRALREIGFAGWATREGNDGGPEETARLMDELLDL